MLLFCVIGGISIGSGAGLLPPPPPFPGYAYDEVVGSEKPRYEKFHSSIACKIFIGFTAGGLLSLKRFSEIIFADLKKKKI